MRVTTLLGESANARHGELAARGHGAGLARFGSPDRIGQGPCGAGSVVRRLGPVLVAVAVALIATFAGVAPRAGVEPAAAAPGRGQPILAATDDSVHTPAGLLGGEVSETGSAPAIPASIQLLDAAGGILAQLPVEVRSTIGTIDRWILDHGRRLIAICYLPGVGAVRF